LLAIALVLVADPVFTDDWLALLITTGFCTDGKAAIAAAAEAPVGAEVPVEATTTVALDAPDA